MYDHLFSPITINKLQVKNRIAYPALGLAWSLDRKLNEKYYRYFAEKARGGAGIVIVGPLGVDFTGSGILSLSLATDEALPSFEKMASLIRAEGASPWVQLFHAGRYAHPLTIDNEIPLAPSPVYSRLSGAVPREMTKEDIRAVQKSFADAARRAKQAGFEGVEVIGSAGYLITQFLSKFTNKRTDEYGGSFENRARFPQELLYEVRSALGPDFPMTIRMAGNDFVPGGNTDEDTPRIAKVYEEAGVDAISVTGGWHETRVPQLPMDLPRTGYAFLAGAIKSAVSVPVMASNRITTPDLAEELIRDGYADMVNLGRVLIADPFWPKKAMENRADEIRPCVACNQGCMDQIFSGQPVYCVCNARAGHEAERNIQKAAKPLKVLVAGAGPAGLEAAVRAAEAGHSVELFEKESVIGGQLWLAGTPPNKKDIWDIIRYYRAMLAKYNIPVHLSTPLSGELVAQLKPDHVIVCEGAEPFRPPIEGAQDSRVLSAWDVLRGRGALGREVAVIGGGAVGLETALFVANKGTIAPEVLHFLFAYDAVPPQRLKDLMFKGSFSVTVFECLDKVGKDVGHSTRWVLMDNIARFGVSVLTGAKVLSIRDNEVTWEVEGARESKKFDTVIMAVGSKPVTRLAQDLKAMGVPFSVAGECTGAGKIDNAIHGGFLAVARLSG